MYKRCIMICLILLLSIQMYGCKPDVEKKEIYETNVQYDTACSETDQPEMTDGKLQTEDTETSEELTKREALDLVDDRGGGFQHLSALGIGTKIYQIAEDGTISVLNSEKYDYTFSNKEEVYWDINGEETMTFKGCFIQDEKIIGLWENKEGDLFEAALCI